MPRLKKLWSFFADRQPRRATKIRAFRPSFETFEERLAMSTLPAPISGALNGLVFVDVNRNNVKDSSDTALTGITVTLSGTTNSSQTVSVTTKTDASGAFNFFELQPGTYTLTRQGLAKYQGSRATPGNLGGKVGTTVIGQVTVGEGQVGTNYNFTVTGLSAYGVSLKNQLTSSGGLKQATPGTGRSFADGSVDPSATAKFGSPALSTLSGIVFDDTNDDGVRQGTENLLSKVQVTLLGTNDTGKDILQTTVTDANGAYQFKDLRPGNYTIQVTGLSKNFRPGIATVGNLGGQVLRNESIAVIEVAAGSTGTGYNFGANALDVVSPSTPQIVAVLANDTFGPGGTSEDGITSDPSVQGYIVANHAIKKFTAGFDATAVGSFVNVLGTLRRDRTFELNAAALNQIFGGTLTAGAHTLHLRAVDSKGKVLTKDITFTLRTTVPTLTLEGGVGTNQDRILSTSSNVVNLKGQMVALGSVGLFVGNSATPLTTTTADGSGDFTFDNITLSPGINEFTVRDAAGNAFSTFFVDNQAPTASSTPLADITVPTRTAAGDPFTTLDLSNKFTDADMSNTIIRFTTSVGTFEVELYDTVTPQTVANYLNYIYTNRYDDVIFNRLIADFALQGGGVTVSTLKPNSASTSFVKTTADQAVRNEADASTRSNLAGTLAMAMNSDPNSATSEFFFNLSDNSKSLDVQNANGGPFTVFGNVVSGADQRLVNTLAAFPTQKKTLSPFDFNNLPLKSFSGTFPNDVTRENLAYIDSVDIVRQTERLSYSVVSVTDSGSNTTTDVTATISNDHRLVITPAVGTAPGDYFVTVRATDLAGEFVDQTFKVTVADKVAPDITSAATGELTVGTNGSITIVSTGNPVATITKSGNLPAGLNFVSNLDGTATISGTPAKGTGGTYNFVFTASNGTAPNDTQNYVLTIKEAPSITSAGATTFALGFDNSFTINTSGFPKATITSTTLPAGISLTDNLNGTATLHGIPTDASGSPYSFTITASNGIGSNATQNFLLTVNNSPAITSASTTTFTVGTAGTFQITTVGTPTAKLKLLNALPAGLTFKDNGNGTATISGTPAAGTGKAYTIGIQATNGVTPLSPAATQNLTLNVNQPAGIVSSNATSFKVGTAGSFKVTTSGFPKATLTLSGDTLPSGVSFVDNGDGTATFSGTPAANTGNTYDFLITASNGVGANAVQNFTLTVNQAPTITSNATATFNVGVAGSFTFQTSGFPLATLSRSGALPTGVTFTNNGDGTATLSGTPAAGTIGNYPLTITAANGTTPNATQSFSFNVAA